MRLALVVPLQPPEFRGGATLVCERLARGLTGRGHPTAVFSGRAVPGEEVGAVRAEPVAGLRTWRVNCGGAFDPWSPEGWWNPTASDSFSAFLAAVRPDVVHVHGLQGLGAGLLERAADAGLPLVLTMHDWWWSCPCLFCLSPEGVPCSPLPRPERCAQHPDYDFSLRRARLRAILARVDRVLVPSAFLRESLVGNGLLAPERVAVQENGLPRPAEAAAAREARLARLGLVAHPSAPLRLAYLGGAGNREKGLPILLEAVARRDDAGRLLAGEDFVLACHAVEPADDGVAVAGAALGARLELHGRYAPEDLDRVLADADVLVLPSVMRESFSLVTREALLRHVPVIASDCGGPQEVVIDGVNGLVVPSADPEALAAAIRKLSADRDLVARLVAATPPRTVTPEAQVAACEALYRELLCDAARRDGQSTEGRVADRPGARGSRGEIRPDGLAVAGTTDARSGRRQRAEPVSLAGRHILFLAGVDGAPLRYRVWNLVEEIEEREGSARVFHHGDPAVLAAVREADLLVLARCPFGVGVAAAVAEARRRRIPIIFSIDDLAFRDDPLHATPALDRLPPGVAEGWAWSLRAHERSFSVADFFLGSTPGLVAAAGEAGTPGFLHRNAVSRALVAVSEVARRRRASRRALARLHGEAPPLRIGFLSGTDCHDRDLERIAGALASVLDRRPAVRLVLGGPVALPETLTRFAGRIDRFATVGWSDLPERVAELDVNLAPLETEQPFNQAKSAVKFLEAALLEVPTVATATAEFHDATDAGRVAVLVERDDDWGDAILGLLDDPSGRARLGAAARAHVLATATTPARADELAGIFLQVLERGPSQSPAVRSPIVMEAGGGGCVALEPPGAAWDRACLAAESAEVVLPGRALEWTWQCRRAGVWRVDVLVGTYGRRDAHVVRFTLRDSWGVVRGLRDVLASAITDRSWVAVELDRGEPARAGERLTLRIEAPAASLERTIVVWTAPTVPAREVEASGPDELWAGRELLPDRSLTFRSFAAGVV